MPTISVFFGITVRMYYQEHEPAHFHAEYQARERVSCSTAPRSPATYARVGHGPSSRNGRSSNGADIAPETLYRASEVARAS
jgi:hypothetical protein